jgi:hypothetical protein
VLYRCACSSGSQFFGEPAPLRGPTPTLPRDVPPFDAKTIEALLVYDAATDCVLLEVDGLRRPAFWPPGTTGLRINTVCEAPMAGASR